MQDGRGAGLNLRWCKISLAVFSPTNLEISKRTFKALTKRTRKSTQVAKVINFTRIEMSCDQLVSTCVGWPNGETRQTTKANASRCKSLQVGGQTKRIINAGGKRASTCESVWPRVRESIKCGGCDCLPFYIVFNCRRSVGGGGVPLCLPGPGTRGFSFSQCEKLATERCGEEIKRNRRLCN